MMKLFRSDLTYSIGGGFLAGALVLFFMQPAEQRPELGQDLSSSVSAASQILS